MLMGRALTASTFKRQWSCCCCCGSLPAKESVVLGNALKLFARQAVPLTPFEAHNAIQESGKNRAAKECHLRVA